MKRMSWVTELMPVLFLALAAFPQSAAYAADTAPPTGTIVINNNRSATNTPNVTLALAWAHGSSGSDVVRMRFSNDGSTWSAWEPLAATRPYTLPGGDAHKTVRVQYLDKANNRSAVYSDYIRLDTTPPTGSIVINSGAATTTSRAVTLGLTWDDGAGSQVSRMRFSDDGAHWTAWMPPTPARAHTLPDGVGYHTVRVQYLDGAGNYSAVYNDYIKLVPVTMEMVSIPAGAFNMGTSFAGDDATYGEPDEGMFTIHNVTLGAYQLGKYEVTNGQYCDVLNWALAQGYLYSDADGTAWPGSGDIYAGGPGYPGMGVFRFLIVSFTSTDCNIQYSGGVFSAKMRVGLPGTTNYSMDAHPMVRVSWWGAVAFCNWLSQKQGLTPCYDLNLDGWPLTTAPPTPGGYRLPTEAEWERAAAWDTGLSKHWIYGFMSDTNTGNDRCNDSDLSYTAVNPLGLAAEPYTSPVGWFNGTNVSPNGSVTTVNSVSPVGAYDMSGNVWEWCGDWYNSDWYRIGLTNSPVGPASGAYRVLRGGSWGNFFYFCRTAYRHKLSPSNMSDFYGFRVARTP